MEPMIQIQRQVDEVFQAVAAVSEVVELSPGAAAVLSALQTCVVRLQEVVDDYAKTFPTFVRSAEAR